MQVAKSLSRAVFFTAVTLAIYVLVPLLGWGLGDARGFFSLPPRVGYCAVMAVFALIAGVQGYRHPEGLRGGKGDDTKRSRRQSVVSAAMIAGMYLVLLLLPRGDRFSVAAMKTGPALRWAGVALTAAAEVLIFWSGIALGKFYSKQVTIQEGHRLITSGPYRVLRHPRYAGVMLWAPGLSLVFRSWAGLLLIPLVFAVLAQRIGDEERLMRETFGGEWDAYVSRTWRLIPWLY